MLGGGTMGAGIAHAFLMAGAEVIVVERDAELAAAAQTRVEGMLAASVERGKTPTSTALTTGTDVSGFAGCGLVVEAVPEIRDLKIEALARIEATIEPGAAIASNTSSISIDSLAAALSRPADFVGLHFFNPVPASQLVEIVLGAPTAARARRGGRDWVAASARRRSPCTTLPASRRRGSGSRSGWRRSGCSSRASRAPRTSTPP